MLTFPNFDPVALTLGPLSIRWYGISYVLGIALAYWQLARYCASGHPISLKNLDDLLFNVVLGVIIGGRLGYMLFYASPELFYNPYYWVAIWHPGMSFHGGLLGVLFALWVTAKQQQHAFLTLSDLIAPVVPIGLGFGRLGNFINGELWGRVTELPWGMVFPGAGPLPRHPSPLYGALLEGLLLYGLLSIYKRKSRPLGRLSALFAMGYGAIRFFEEFLREPDSHIGFIAWGWLTMGQLLSFPLIAIGLYLYVTATRRSTHAPIS